MDMTISSYLHFFADSSQVLLVLMLTAFTCSLIGIFIVLRRLSMISDAIAHSVFLGIVLAYFVTSDITSPLLIIGAALFGVLTVYAIELISQTGLIKHNDAVGVVFPLFFSLAVILLTKFARSSQLNLDVVLLGEVILSPLNTYTLWGFTLPKAAWIMGILLIGNSIFLAIFYKELKVSTFDKEFATLIGFSSTLLFYGLMTMASITAVAAFDSVGAILVISFLIVPPSTALLFTKSLKSMITWTLLISAWNSFWGYALSLYWNVSMSGMSALIAGITFIIIFLFHQHGPLYPWRQKLIAHFTPLRSS